MFWRSTEYPFNSFLVLFFNQIFWKQGMHLWDVHPGLKLENLFLIPTPSASMVWNNCHFLNNPYFNKTINILWGFFGVFRGAKEKKSVLFYKILTNYTIIFQSIWKIKNWVYFVRSWVTKVRVKVEVKSG